MERIDRAQSSCDPLMPRMHVESKGRYSDQLCGQYELFRNTTVIGMFRRAVEAQPDRIALFMEDKAYTFRQVDEMSNSVARTLDKIGIEPGEFVAVMSGREMETIIAILGIWKAGCAYIFLDRDYPQLRNLECMRECGARLVLTQQFIDDDIMLADNAPFADRSRPEGMAVVVYTSGTTSRPKGVLLTQRNIMTAISSFDQMDFNSDDRYCCFASLMFVASVYDIVTSLCIGCALTLMPRHIRKDIQAIARFYRDNQITVAFLPPHMAEKYQSVDENSPLRVLICGSEAARNLRPSSYRIVHVYASSEACGIISRSWITEKKSSYPIGHPLPQLKIYIVDENGNPVEEGKTGELWVSGEQICHGYLEQPEESRKHFCRNPFMDDVRYKRIFKTGDLVREDSSGSLWYEGRIDTMVKVRGFRIELAAVEQTMMEFPGIREVLCKVYQDRGGENVMFGYYRADRPINHEQLRAYISMSLPYYMIPTGLIETDSFVYTENGKIDRHQFSPPPEINDHKACALKYR